MYILKIIWWSQNMIHITFGSRDPLTVGIEAGNSGNSRNRNCILLTGNWWAQSKPESYELLNQREFSPNCFLTNFKNANHFPPLSFITENPLKSGNALTEYYSYCF